MTPTGNLESSLANAELLQELGQLRLQVQMEEITTQKLLNDLSKNETFVYIQNLQAEVEKLREQLRDVNSQLLAAKVSCPLYNVLLFLFIVMINILVGSLL